MDGGRKNAVVWFRQDLRLADNPALWGALKAGAPIVAVYVLDDDAADGWAFGGAHRWWLHRSLSALAHRLAGKGAPLVLRKGRAEVVLAHLARDVGAAEVHAGLLCDPWGRRQERRVADALQRVGARLHLHRSATLFDPDMIRTNSSGVYGVYTPFARACRAYGDLPVPRPAPPRIPTALTPVSDSLEDWRLLPAKPDWSGGLQAAWEPGEMAARHRLKDFLAHDLGGYDERRDYPGVTGTSLLSPYLHWGELSPLMVWNAALRTAPASVGCQAFLRELLWREFSLYLLWHHPHLPNSPLRPEFGGMKWRDDQAALHAWQRGRTGIPIVDAGMRQLWSSGWMHNRVRMIVASFLVKHLLIPWQKGAAWFWDTLVDGDLANNSVNWQWVAGCGADAAPFFRIFNPVLQGRKFDPDGSYVRRWIPELSGLGAAHIHAPWEARGAVLEQAKVQLGEDYPWPLVDVAKGRARALDAYRALARSRP